jgi:hypothetical protein
MTTARPATVDAFRAIFREERPNLVIEKATFSSSRYRAGEIQRAVDDKDIGAGTLTGGGGQMNSS